MHEQPLRCHMDGEYNARSPAHGAAEVCYGARVVMANMCKRPRDPKFQPAPADRETCFSNLQEMVEAHRAAPVKSWAETPGVAAVRVRLGLAPLGKKQRAR